MSFKEWVAAQRAATKDKAEAKSKEVAAAANPAPQDGKAPVPPKA